MRKLFLTFMKDMKLSFKSLYIYIEIGMAFIMIAVMLFVVPENFSRTQDIYIYLESSEILSVIQNFSYQNTDNLSQNASESIVNIHLMASRKSYDEKLSENKKAIGVIASVDEGEVIDLTFSLQGFEGEAFRGLIQAAIESALFPIDSTNVTVEKITLQNNPQKMSDRVAVMPVYLTMNVAFMGLFIIAAYIFLDKDEGVIRAYAVAPVSIWQYLSSKVLVMLLMGIVTSLMVTLAIVGLNVNYLAFVALVISLNFFGSALGLLVASYFDTMMKAMGALYITIMVMALGMVGYYLPSFNPIWIRILPSYTMLFSFRELFLKGGNSAFVYKNALIFFVLGMMIMFWSVQRFKKTLTL